MEEHGLRAIARNWRCSVGELTLWPRKMRLTSAGGAPTRRVLVEVRTPGIVMARRCNPSRRKQAKLREVAAAYLAATAGKARGAST
ncbi:MAG: YraN family protein [Caldilineaceae bacterium]